MVKWLAAAVWVAALIVGAFGVWQRLTLGHEGAGYGSYVPWGLWVAVYALGVGIAAGASMLASIPYAFGLKSQAKTGPLLLWISLVSLGCGMLIALLDLGKTERFWKLILTPQLGSIMALLVWIYGVFGLITLLQLLIAIRGSNGDALKWLSYLAIPVALAVGAGEGTLFGTMAARPYWNTPILPVIFLSTAAVSGIGIAALVLAIVGKGPRLRIPDDMIVQLGKMILALIVVNLVIEAAQIGVQVFSATPSEGATLQEMLFGSYGWYFWGLYIVAGSIIPGLLLALAPRSIALVAVAGTLASVGTLGLRLSILVPGLMVPEFKGLERSFVEPRLVFAYTPSGMEWMVSMFMTVVAIGLFYAGYKILPLAKDNPAAASKEPRLRTALASKVSGGSD